ncbi:Serine/threonine-protein phosphatase 2A activator [Acropora cervicornis]|uniref:Serine/threonine-protein phosphatase 2A activator n=1 Tax=Acropora cervicornis TaxID=6130 RepID=A0AAD9UZH0_ACRCE|nr:Serine/threonine-protein phosphatase 2A activator [Acropora cervicornis]
MAASDEAPVFVEPQREIRCPTDLTKWEKSQAYSDFIGFVLTLNDAVKGKSMSGDYHMSKICKTYVPSGNLAHKNAVFNIQASKKLVVMLDTMNSWIDEIPPTDQPQRFGNKAFRTWCNRLEEVRDNITELYVL